MTSHPGIVRAITWNLFHGRDHPPDPALFTRRGRLLRVTERNATHVQVNRSLLDEFGATLAGWEWDVALLQEVPPRWLRPLAEVCDAAGALALTARNELPWLRGRLADFNPDLIGSNDGGANALLVRRPLRIEQVERHRVALRPERRRLMLARLAHPRGRLVVANTHLSVGATGRGRAELVAAAQRAIGFAGGGSEGGCPVLLGGDLNLRPARAPTAFADLRSLGFSAPTEPQRIDHLLARELEVVEPPASLPATARELAADGGLALRLSDHAPVTGAFKLR